MLSLACRKKCNPVAYSKFLVAALMSACSTSVPKRRTFFSCSFKATRIKLPKLPGLRKNVCRCIHLSSAFLVCRRRCLYVVWVTSNLPILKVESISSMLNWSGFVKNQTMSCSCFSGVRTTPNGANL